MPEIEHLITNDVRKSDGSIHDSSLIYFIRRYFQVMKDALEIDGVDLRACIPCGNIDLVSTGTGEIRKRYGFLS